MGDSIWSAADNRTRGFLLGATAGRTTLNGEGLQHEDGHSLLVSTTVPCCVSYDPTYAYEVAVILREGLRRMIEAGEDIFYYITLYNENFDMPPMPAGVEEGILRGLYLIQEAGDGGRARVRLLGSGSILPQVVEAAKILEEKYSVNAEVWSATSYSELRRDALRKERFALLHPGEKAPPPLVSDLLPAGGGPVIAVSDFMKMVPDQIARWVPDGLLPLGTDGFGRSDSREALRRFFEVDTAAVVTTALSELCRRGQIEAKEVLKAMQELGVDPDQSDPTAD